MLDIRHIVAGKHPSLVGPTTSINGVFLGPFYYYLNVIPFIAGGGDPAFLVYWNILIYAAAGILLFYITYKTGKVFALISASIYFMAPALFYSSRYFWSANPMPPLVLIYFLLFYLLLKKPSTSKALLLGLTAGLGMQIEAAFGILLLPFAFLWMWREKLGFKKIFYLILGFSLTLIPQIIFELRHQFIMTKTFTNEAFGNSATLGQKLPIPDALISHALSFIEFTNQIFELPGYFGLVILIIASVSLGYIIYKKNISDISKKFFLVSSFFILYSFIFYALYPHYLKGWYLLGLRIPYILIIAAFFTELFNSSFKKYVPIKVNFSLMALGFFLVVYSFINTTIVQSRLIPKDEAMRSQDKSTLRNELEVIDWVYRHTEGQGFKAYNYIPSVYDYPYQYLYWWYGTKKYGYQPEEIGYMENALEYIPENKNYLTKTKPQQDGLIALIYEDDENPVRKFAWGGSFTKYCPITDIRFTWGSSAEIRSKCPEGTTNQNKLR